MKKLLVIGFICFTAFAVSAQCIDEIGFYEINGTFSLAAKDQYMILSSGDIVDNSSIINPTLVGQFSLNGFASSIITENNFAYFGTGMTNNLYIADISIITFPMAKGSIDFQIGNGVFGMAYDDGILFAALGGDGVLCSINVADKDNPQLLDTIYLTGGQCRDVAVVGNYALAASEGGLRIIDKTDPASMSIVTSIGSGYNSIALGDEYAFMGKSIGGVDVYNISDITNPMPAFAIVNQNGTAWDLAYRDNLLYVATDLGGLFIYKIGNNMAEEMATYQHPGNGQSFGVCVQDSLILLPGLVEGVSLLMYDSTGFVGIKKDFNKNDLMLFPNPSRQFMQVSINNSDLVSEIEIFNMEGKLVFSEKAYNSNFQIDVSKLKTGKYILKAIINKKTISKSFIKIE